MAGFATARERELSDAVMFFLRGAERDRLLLLSMICGGHGKFRKVMAHAWRYLKVDHELIDAVWGYLVLLGGANPHEQLHRLLEYQRMSPVQRIRHQTGMN